MRDARHDRHSWPLRAFSALVDSPAAPMTRPTRHRMEGGGRARLGAAAIGLGGLAFGVIQVLQGSVNAFNPRPVVAVLCAVAVGLAGLSAERLRSVSAHNRDLRDALAAWPPPRLRDADLLLLGVFPRAPTGNGAAPYGPYVPRDADASLREALSRGGLTVVVGPERAGKSRSAAESARALWPDRAVVIPADGGGLRALIDDHAVVPSPTRSFGSTIWSASSPTSTGERCNCSPPACPRSWRRSARRRGLRSCGRPAPTASGAAGFWAPGASWRCRTIPPRPSAKRPRGSGRAWT